MGFSKRYWLSAGAAGAVILVAGPAAAQSCPNGEPRRFGECPAARPADDANVYEGSDYTLTFAGCQLAGRQARCEAWVDPRRNLTWHYTADTYLAASDGGLIPARLMVIGQSAVTVADLGYQVRFMRIAAGVRTRISYTFDLNTAPDQVQALVIDLPGRRTANFRPEWR